MSTGLAWSVGAVSERVGIARSTLRTWDRRYGLGPSSRTGGGHRRYSEDDISRLEAMRILIDQGAAPEAVARVVQTMSAADLLEAAGNRPPVPTAFSLSQIMAAAAERDSTRLSTLFAAAIDAKGVVAAWTEVISPAMRHIGSGWFDGTMGLDAERLASDRLMTELRALTHRDRQDIHRPATVLLTGASDDPHFLPLVALEAALAGRGIASNCLGGSVPSDALRDLIGLTRPVVVLMWASLERPVDDPIWTAFGDVGRPITVLLGGPGWVHARPEIEDVTVETVTTLEQALERCAALT